MVGGDKLVEAKKADTQIGAQKTAEQNLAFALVGVTGQTQQYVQDNYLTPPVGQAQQNLEEDLNELNPRIENKEFMPQLLSLFETARTETGEAARQARESLGSGIKLLKASAEAALSPKWQEQVDAAVPIIEQQAKEPENKEIAERARLRLDTISENHSMYLDLQNGTNIPEERIDNFMDKRAATEAKSNKKRQFVALPS